MFGAANTGDPTTLKQTYEGMFVLDNDAVRADWQAAKRIVTDFLAKHGAELKTARRWDERRLSYPIKNHVRATFLLCFFEQDGENPTLLRDLELNETVLRYLILRTPLVPAMEYELSEEENKPGYEPPPVPEDMAPAAEEGASAAETVDVDLDQIEAEVAEAVEEIESVETVAVAADAPAAKAPAAKATEAKATESKEG